MKSPITVALWGVAMTGLWLLVPAQDAGAKVRDLSAEEAEAVVGGVGVTSLNPSGDRTSQYDNVRFDVGYDNPFAPSGEGVAIFADSTKTAGRTVSAATGRWQTRTLWPTSGYKRFKFRWWSRNGTWTTMYTGPRSRVSSTVHMLDVKVWNTTVGGTTTGATQAQMSQLFDNLSYNYSWNNTHSLDAIYGQCSGSEQLQFRLKGMASTTLSNCPSTIPFGHPLAPGPLYGVSPDCLGEAFEETTNNGNDFSAVNLVIVPTIGNGFYGFHIRGFGYESDREHWIAVEEAMLTHPQIASAIAHEIGHFTLIGDGSHASSNRCPRNSEGLLRCNVNNAVMCAHIGSCGRKIDSGECAQAFDNPPPYYVDHN